VKLTASNVRTITLPHGKREKTFFDDDLPGFGLRLREGGGRIFVVQYKHGRQHRRLTIGDVAAIDVGKARSTAKDVLAAVRLGRDPFAERRESRAAAHETFGALLPRYLARQRAKLKPRSYSETERHLVVNAKPLHSLPVAAIDRRAIAARLAEIADSSGASAANRVRASLGAYFTWLAREGLIEVNVVANTNRAPESGPRDRVLSDTELRQIWNACTSLGQYGDIVQLLVLTAARRDEIGSLHWAEIDFEGDAIVLPPDRVKNKRQHEIPLSMPAVDILLRQQHRSLADGTSREFIFGRGAGPFSGWSKSKGELDARIADALPDWRIHDLRRTASTRMHDPIGIAPHIVEAVLGHVSGHKAGVAGVYNYAAYQREKRNALDRWAEYVLSIVEDRDPVVVPLRAAP
jgi:integrase